MSFCGRRVPPLLGSSKKLSHSLTKLHEFLQTTHPVCRRRETVPVRLSLLILFISFRTNTATQVTKTFRVEVSPAKQIRPHFQRKTILRSYATAMTSPTVKLSSGENLMPIVGFGLWKVNNDTCAAQVYNAIKSGYRLFDGACGNPSLNPLHTL